MTHPETDNGSDCAKRPKKRARSASPEQDPIESARSVFTHKTALHSHGSQDSSTHPLPSIVRPGSVLPGSPSLHPTPQVTLDLGNATDQAYVSEEYSKEVSEPESEKKSSELAEQGFPRGWIAESENEGDDLGSEWIAESESESTGLEDETGNTNEDKMSVSEVRDMLRRNRMYVEDPEAAVRGQMLVKKAKEIIDERRASKMTGEEVDRIVESLQFYSTKNEKTLLINLWQLLVKKTRFCKMKLPSGEEEILSPEEELEAAKWIEKAWRVDDKLWTKWDAEFFSHTLPEIATTGDLALDQLLALVPRVGKPVPDICIGFDGKAFSEKVLAVLQEFGCKLTAEQWISFFALDAKGADGPIGVAANQCCRSGAAMAKGYRDFFKAINAYLSTSSSQGSESPPAQSAQPQLQQQQSTNIKYPRPDMNSFAFSAALDPELVILYVHWAEETGERTEVWQQTRLRSYKLDDTDDLELLRRNIDNILDWGIASRKRKIETLCEMYLEQYSRLNAGQKASASKRAKEAVESSTIKRHATDSAASKKRKTGGEGSGQRIASGPQTNS
ncbi:MAG: hypothetical protein Q9207_006261 [Kuettlingeria erythrocarpa]